LFLQLFQCFCHSWQHRLRHRLKQPTESHTGRSATFLEFQEQCSCTCYLLVEINRYQTEQIRRVKWGKHTVLKTKKLQLLLLVGRQSWQNVCRDPSHVKHLPYNSLACPLREVILSNDFRSDNSSLLFDDLESFLPGLFYVTCGLTACTLTIFNRSFTFEYRRWPKSLCFFPWNCHWTLFFVLRCNVPDSEATLRTKVLFLSRKSRMAHNTHSE
jgi:hypothetical protein